MIAIVAFVIIAAVLVASLPLLASTNLVKDRIAQQVSTWSGFRVTLDEAPDIDVFPSLKTVLRGVTVYSWSDTEVPILEADQVEAGLSIFSAFGGQAEINTVTLLRPRFFLGQDGKWDFPLPTGGELANTLRSAFRALEDSSTEELDPGILASKIGSFRVIDGQTVLGPTHPESDNFTSINAEFSWPALGSSARFSADVIWRGEAVDLTVSSSNPLLAFARKPAPILLELTSVPVRLNFNGSASLYDGLFFDGTSQFRSPSLNRAVGWYGIELAALSAINEISLTAKVTGGMKRIKLEDANITSATGSANGFLDIIDEDANTSISGTLAFDQLDIMAFLSAFGGVPTNIDRSEGEIDLSFFDRLKLDLRLSAAEADAGPFMLSDAAATVQLKEKLAAFDLSGANTLGGTVQASLQLDRKQNYKGGELRLLATNVSGLELAEATDFGTLIPNGPISFSAILKGPGSNWNTLLRNSNGSISISFGQGQIAGFNLDDFIAKIAETGFFPLQDVSGGSTRIEQANVDLKMVDGIAQIEGASLDAGDHKLEFTGLVAPFSNSIALSGNVRGIGGDEESEPVAFFLGGAPASPFVTAMNPPASAE